MKSAKKLITMGTTSVVILFLIVDSKTATANVSEGIRLCLNVVIPSLFPMLIIASQFTDMILDSQIKLPGILQKQLKLQQGEDILFLSGFLCGYPIGANGVHRAYTQGYLSKPRAEQLLRCCNNAGPAFIFGIGATIFPSPIYSAITWMIQIISAIIITTQIPKTSSNSTISNIKINNSSNTIKASLEKMSIICTWVILFRVLTSFLQNWFLWILPAELNVLLTGFLELTNGACQLANISSLSTRFVLFNTILSFGGICVHIQTAGVCSQLDMTQHKCGKILQCIAATILSICFCLIAPNLFIS